MTRGTMGAKHGARRAGKKMRSGKHSPNHEPKARVTVSPKRVHMPTGAKAKAGATNTPAAQIAAAERRA